MYVNVLIIELIDTLTILKTKSNEFLKNVLILLSWNATEFLKLSIASLLLLNTSLTVVLINVNPAVNILTIVTILLTTTLIAAPSPAPSVLAKLVAPPPLNALFIMSIVSLSAELKPP